MENRKMDHAGYGHGIRKRLFKWAKSKMTGEEAFGIFYGEKAKYYPEEMKKEFAELFDRKKELFEQFAADRKAFTEKWKDVTGDEYGMPEDGMCGGAHPHGHHGGPHGHGRGPGFGW